MARTPKATPPAPVPAPRGRKPKAAEPIEFAAATNGAAEEADAVEVEAATVKAARGKPGPKPKQRPETAVPALPKEDEQQPAMNLDQSGAKMEQAPAQADAIAATMAYSVSADDGAATASSDAGVGNAPPVSSQDSSEQPKSAARWDRTADTVQFDWPEIEQTAAQDGPNQVMAKLLVAARAEGANSRWPL